MGPVLRRKDGSYVRRDIDVALAAAQAGVDVVRAAYGTSLIRYAKSDSDFATNVDLDAERAILDVTPAERPADTRVGEESGRTAASDLRRWLVDPLCGTLNFAARTPLMAVNVALLDDPCLRVRRPHRRRVLLG